MIDEDFLPIFLDEAVEILEHWEAASLKLEGEPSQEVLGALFRAAHNLKGSSRSVGLEEFGRLVHSAEDLITKLKSLEQQPTTEVIQVLLDTQSLLLDWVEALRADPAAKLDTSELVERLEQLTKDKQGDLFSSSDAFGFFDELSEEPANEAPMKAVTKPSSLESASIEADTQSSKKAPQQKADETIRVSIRKLDQIIRLIGELSIQHAIVCNARDTGKLSEVGANEAIGLSQKVIQDLQSEAMTLRMQPLEGLFRRMERVCLDVARQLKKPIKVELRGTDVELDKTVIERVKDPLVHILRNAVDHGIESSGERLSKDKPETAKVIIEGVQTAANVSIRILDDGKGIDPEKIFQRAVEKGIVDPSKELSKKQIIDLIFQPGFSTAEKVTDVSGRGVGMDVVKRAVDDLSGSISIDSQLGMGTLFTISLPSTLSILDAIIVGLADRLYAVPVQDVEEVVDLSETKIETTTQRGKVLNLRGKILPVEPLSEYLPRSDQDVVGSPQVALIANHHDTVIAFAVDEVCGQQSIVVRQLEGRLAEVPGFTGATILSNGEPSMIIHLPQIVKSHTQSIA